MRSGRPASGRPAACRRARRCVEGARSDRLRRRESDIAQSASTRIAADSACSAQRQGGQATAEYIVVLLLVAMVGTVLVSSPIGGVVESGIRKAVCTVIDQKCAVAGTAAVQPSTAPATAPVGSETTPITCSSTTATRNSDVNILGIGGSDTSTTTDAQQSDGSIVQTTMENGQIGFEISGGNGIVGANGKAGVTNSSMLQLTFENKGQQAAYNKKLKQRQDQITGKYQSLGYDPSRVHSDDPATARRQQEMQQDYERDMNQAQIQTAQDLGIPYSVGQGSGNSLTSNPSATLPLPGIGTGPSASLAATNSQDSGRVVNSDGTSSVYLHNSAQSGFSLGVGGTGNSDSKQVGGSGNGGIGHDKNVDTTTAVNYGKDGKPTSITITKTVQADQSGTLTGGGSYDVGGNGVVGVGANGGVTYSKGDVVVETTTIPVNDDDTRKAAQDLTSDAKHGNYQGDPESSKILSQKAANGSTSVQVYGASAKGGSGSASGTGLGLIVGGFSYGQNTQTQKLKSAYSVDPRTGRITQTGACS